MSSRARCAGRLGRSSSAFSGADSAWGSGGLGFDARKIGVEVLKAKLQLIVIQPLGTLAELAALELLDDEMKPLDLGVRLAQSGALGRERAHQGLQRLHIIWQCGEIDVHKRRL
jgi:hypothetical protein